MLFRSIYNAIFEAFGPSHIGQIVGATVIGGIVGFTGGLRNNTYEHEKISLVLTTAGGAAIGFCAATILVGTSLIGRNGGRGAGCLRVAIIGVLVIVLAVSACLVMIAFIR
jgi:hypothetical protein